MVRQQHDRLFTVKKKAYLCSEGMFGGQKPSYSEETTQ